MLKGPYAIFAHSRGAKRPKIGLRASLAKKYAVAGGSKTSKYVIDTKLYRRDDLLIYITYNNKLNKSFIHQNEKVLNKKKKYYLKKPPTVL